MPGDAKERKAVKDALEAVHAQIGLAVKRVDKANPEELAELKGAAGATAAFVDFNNGCHKDRSTSDLIKDLHG